MKAVFNLPERPNPRPRDCEIGLCSKAHHRRDAHELAPAIAFLHLAVDQARLHLPPAHVAPSTTQLDPLTKVSRDGIEVEIEPVTGKERQATRNQDLSQGVQNHVRHVLRAWTQSEHWKNRACRDQWPARATGLAWRCAAGCVVRPAGGEGAGDGRSSARARSVRAGQHESERLVLVACR
jgi:hypothetical protein